MIDINEIEPYLAGLISDVLAAGGVVGGVRIGGGLWIGAVDQAPDAGDLYLEGSIRKSEPVAVRLSLGAAVLVGSGSWVPVMWDTADSNEAGMWAAGAPTLITCLVDGLYQITFNANFAANAVGYRAAGIQLNGGLPILATAKEFSPSGAVTAGVSLGLVVCLAVGDTIEGIVFQNTGGGLNLGAVESNIGVVRLA